MQAILRIQVTDPLSKLHSENGEAISAIYSDMYVKIENTRLDYIRDHQRKIRTDLYQGLLDSVAMGEQHASNIGHRVILPPSFIGGPRDMRR